MSILEIFMIAFALSLDAFAVSISCGIKLNRILFKKYLKIAVFFGGFQSVMPLLGWVLGFFIKDFIAGYAPWVAMMVFLCLGVKTIYDARKIHPCNACQCFCNNLTCLLSLSIATSIDAFVIGLLLAFMKVSLWHPLLIIGLVTFLISLAGCFIGNKAGSYMGRKAGFVSGLILLCLAVKIGIAEIL